MNDEVVQMEEMAVDLIRLLSESYPGTLQNRYASENSVWPENKDAYEILRCIARSRGCLKKGEELDTEKAAYLLMDDFRAGRLGRISLEVPEI